MKIALSLLIMCSFLASARAQFRPNFETNEHAIDSLRIADSTANYKKIDIPPKDREFLKNQVAFGGTIGTPGGLNFVAEGYYDRMGIRLEAGWCLFFVSGYEADLSYVVNRSAHSLYEFSAIYFHNYIIGPDEPAYWTSGIGVALAVDAEGFFFQVGAGHTKSINVYGYSDSAPSLINSWPMVMQIGYVH
ncbi:MAG TPA: hypothetical protein VG537_00585 [Candidatus Kapabacteria bacterium]|nr:hypothetical protein [Candidatus Kapabacteria bacterium]